MRAPTVSGLPSGSSWGAGVGSSEGAGEGEAVWPSEVPEVLGSWEPSTALTVLELLDTLEEVSFPSGLEEQDLTSSTMATAAVAKPLDLLTERLAAEAA